MAYKVKAITDIPDDESGHFPQGHIGLYETRNGLYKGVCLIRCPVEGCTTLFELKIGDSDGHTLHTEGEDGWISPSMWHKVPRCELHWFCHKDRVEILNPPSEPCATVPGWKPPTMGKNINKD